MIRYLFTIYVNRNKYRINKKVWTDSHWNLKKNTITHISLFSFVEIKLSIISTFVYSFRKIEDLQIHWIWWLCSVRKIFRLRTRFVFHSRTKIIKHFLYESKFDIRTRNDHAQISIWTISWVVNFTNRWMHCICVIMNIVLFMQFTNQLIITSFAKFAWEKLVFCVSKNVLFLQNVICTIFFVWCKWDFLLLF